MKQSPESLAQSVLDEARVQPRSQKKARALIHPLFWFLDWGTLDRADRSRVIRKASRCADREFRVILTCFCSLLAGALAIYLRPAAPAGVPLVFLLPFLLVRTARARHHVRALLRERAVARSTGESR